ncbi:glutathione S-transferase C-terminal domain-containing protein-like [Styela clava]
MTKNITAHEDTLYLDGEYTEHGQCFKAETQSILLLSSYCSKIQLSLVLVTKVCLNKGQLKNGIQVPDDCFSSIENKLDHEIPSCIRDCRLPAVCSSDQTNIYSGLCTVLRFVLKRAANMSADVGNKSKLLSLLGHRLYCLKACSEVSPRTKMCEIHMPLIVNNALSDTKRNNEIDIPEGIVLFENLMKQPVVIHNMDKRQRVLLQKLDKSIGNEPIKDSLISKKEKQVVWTKDLPQLEHVFAEGVDFSISDICIFPCVHYFLKTTNISLIKDKIPGILKWYKRMKVLPRLKTALFKCGESFLHFENDGGEKLDSHPESNGTEVIELATGENSEDKKDGKKRIEMTIRRDLPALLQKFNLYNIAVEFSKFNEDEILLEWKSFPKELHPIEGELSSLRAMRKCHQIENLAHVVKNIAKEGDRIVDFCSGGGHVGIVLAHLLPNCKIILVENKEESLDRARARISALKLNNITIYQCNLEYFRGSFEIGVALHACGVASDMVVQTCISRKASFVISPCCYGKVRNCHWINYPQSKLFRRIPVLFEESLLLGHAADKTSWNFENKHAVEGKLCMGLVDVDRMNAAKEHGYNTELYTMQPHTCSPKNNMLVGIAPAL